MKKGTKVTQQNLLFLDEFLKSFSPTKAALAAGYSAKCARQTAFRILQRPFIQQELQRIQAERRKTAIISFEERAAILSEIARGRVGHYVKTLPDGMVTIKPDEGRMDSAALAQLEETVLSERAGGGFVTKLKLRDPVQAIRELNEMYGDHAPKRIVAELSGTIDNMTEDQIDAELQRIAQEEAAILAGKKKARKVSAD